jgi:hypothetical protein
MFGSTLLKKTPRTVPWQSVGFVTRFISVTEDSMGLALCGVICSTGALVVHSQTMRSEEDYLYKMIQNLVQKLVVVLLPR